jgi:hypothetical protein
MSALKGEGSRAGLASARDSAGGWAEPWTLRSGAGFDVSMYVSLCLPSSY